MAVASQLVRWHLGTGRGGDRMYAVDISDPTNLQVVGSNSELVPFFDGENDQEYYQEAFAVELQGKRDRTNENRSEQGKERSI